MENPLQDTEHTPAQVKTPDSVTLLGAELCCLLPVDARELVNILHRLRAAGQAQYDTGRAPCPLPAIELMLTRDADMAQSNREYMGLPGPTNVLSFPAHAPDGEASMPASLILSVDTLLREAFMYNQPIKEHLLRLLAHGFGHAAGYDHSPEMDVFCDNLLNKFAKK